MKVVNANDKSYLLIHVLYILSHICIFVCLILASPIPSSSRSAHKSKQNLPPPPPLNISSLSNEIELTKEYTEIANNSTLKTNESESSLPLEGMIQNFQIVC